MDLNDLKRDLGILRLACTDAGVELRHDAKHNPCPFCQDESGLSLFHDDQGVARWKCHSRCDGASGTIIDFMMRAGGIDQKEAIRQVMERFGNKAKPAEPRRLESSKKDSKRKDTDGKFFGTWQEVRDFWDKAFAAQGAVFEFEWTYERVDPVEPLVKILRYKHASGKKEVRPNRRVASGWRVGLGDLGSAGKLLPVMYLPKIMRALKALKAGEPQRTQSNTEEKTA